LKSLVPQAKRVVTVYWQDKDIIASWRVAMLQVPPPGEYILQSTQEKIVNPDLMTMWTQGTRNTVI
jgi:hypothetical protein